MVYSAVTSHRRRFDRRALTRRDASLLLAGSSPCLPPLRVASLPQFRYCAVSAAALPESRELAARGVDGRQDPGGCCTVVLRDRADWGSVRRVCAAGGRHRGDRSSEVFGSDILVKEAVSSFLVIMEPKHSAEMSKHLDKQNHALMETYRAMSHELHKLQVEEETIMRKLYGLMSAEGLLPKPKKERQLEKARESTQENEERGP